MKTGFKSLKKPYSNNSPLSQYLKRSEFELEKTKRTAYFLTFVLLIISFGAVFYVSLYFFKQSLIERSKDHLLTASSLLKEKIKTCSDFSQINDILLLRSGLGETGENYLVDISGHILTPTRFLKDISQKKIFSDFLKPWPQVEDVFIETQDYRNISVFSYRTQIDYQGESYALFSEIDTSEVMRPLKKVRTLLISLFTFFFLITLLLSSFLSKKIFSLFQSLLNKLDAIHIDTKREILQAQEKTKERFALNLHDSIGQHATTLLWSVKKLHDFNKQNEQDDQIQCLQDATEELIKDIRHLSQDMMPSLLKDFGLKSSLVDFLERQSTRNHFNYSLEFDEHFESVIFRKDFELNVYRITQELVSNFLKHAQQKNFTLNFKIYEETFFIYFSHDYTLSMPPSQKPKTLEHRCLLFEGSLILTVNSTYQLQFCFPLESCT